METHLINNAMPLKRSFQHTAALLLALFGYLWLVHPAVSLQDAPVSAHAACSCGCDENTVACCCAPPASDSGPGIQSCGNASLAVFSISKVSDGIPIFFRTLPRPENTLQRGPLHISTPTPQDFYPPIEHPPSLHGIA